MNTYVATTHSLPLTFYSPCFITHPSVTYLYIKPCINIFLMCFKVNGNHLFICPFSSVERGMDHFCLEVWCVPPSARNIPPCPSWALRCRLLTLQVLVVPVLELSFKS